MLPVADSIAYALVRAGAECNTQNDIEGGPLQFASEAFAQLLQCTQFCVCGCVCGCMRVWVRACVRTCVRASVSCCVCHFACMRDI